MTRRKVAVVTVARSDYGSLRPVLHRLKTSPALELQLIVGGAHLEAHLGNTEQAIKDDGHSFAATIPMNLVDDSPAGVARSAAMAHAGFAAAYASLEPDVLVLLGDRIETHAAAVAAVPFRLPVAHIHGGELTLGAIDDCLRHSITKLAHLHFAATESYRDRILQMGEEAWRVVATGAPGVDAVLGVTPLKRGEIEARLNMKLSQDPLLVTFHPATLEKISATDQVNGLLSALAIFDRPIIISGPNADTGSVEIRTVLQRFSSLRGHVRFVENLDTPAYVGLMRTAAAMVGNSSSGVIEAPSFGLPVVNIGGRQAGRVRGENVIDVSYDVGAIEAGIRRALDSGFRRRLASAANPYGDGHAAERIVAALEHCDPRERLLHKQFQDIKSSGPLRLTG